MTTPNHKKSWPRPLVGLSVLVMLAAACSQLAGPGASSTDLARLADIEAVDELRAAFVQDSGRPRLLLLLSPT